jgi:hypothetical protein
LEIAQNVRRWRDTTAMEKDGGFLPKSRYDE